MTDVDEFLAHYGVKGMKWGVRKDRSSGSGGSSGASSGSSGKSGASGKVGMDPATAISLGILGGYYAGVVVNNSFQSGANRSRITRGKAFVTMKSEYWDQKPKFANKSYSADDIQSKVVPGINPNYPGRGTTMNCRRATFAYEMRRRGYDVEATLTTNAYGQDARGLSKSLGLKGREKRQSMFELEMNGGGQNIIGPGGGKEIFKALDKQPERSRGELVMQWKSPQPGIPGGAHSVAYEVINGKAHVFDTQSGVKHSADSPIFANSANSSFTRLDNKDLNDKFLTRWLK